jgi:hypothetical protein
VNAALVCFEDDLRFALAASPRDRDFIWIGQHRYELDVDVLLQQVEASRPEAGENRRLQVLVEIFARASILIEDKQVWIVIADMEMVVHARGFCTRRLDEAVKHLEQLVPFFRLGVQIRDQGASRLHVVLPD